MQQFLKSLFSSSFSGKHVSLAITNLFAGFIPGKGKKKRVISYIHTCKAFLCHRLRRTQIILSLGFEKTSVKPSQLEQIYITAVATPHFFLPQTLNAGNYAAERFGNFQFLLRQRAGLTFLLSNMALMVV